ncbi:MAG: ROK family glucokinase [Marmoricola sp.]
MSAEQLAIGIDIGGTKIAAGLVRSDELLESREVATPTDSAAAILDEVADLVEALRPSRDAIPVGVSAAGYIDLGRRAVTYAPNLPWRDEPLQPQLQERLGVPVVLENDANCAAWAEFRFGAGMTFDHMVMITVGTGIGGGVVTNGRLLIGGHGVAGELGHIQVVSDLRPNGDEPPRPCGCGAYGCWEMYGSGTALELSAQLAVATPEGRTLLERIGGDPDKLTGTVITQAAVEGDAVAMRLVDELGRWLGEGLASISAVLDPEVIVVGGGVAESGELVMRPLEDAYQARMGQSHRPTAAVRSAALGNRAGMLGAADLAWVSTTR